MGKLNFSIMRKYFIILSFFVMACGGTKKGQQTASLPSIKDSNNSLFVKEKFDVQGHRGCRGLMPENSIAAMLKAIDWGVSTLEMDVVITQDKKVILSHEAFFNHEITTKPDGSFVTEAEEQTLKIYQMEYTQVKTFDVGLKPHPRFSEQKKIKTYKPLLAEVFNEVTNYCTKHKKPLPYFNIETKSEPSGDVVFHPKPDEFTELLMQVIKAAQMENHVIIQSFDVRTLQYLHQHYPSIKVAMLQEEFDITLGTDYIKKLGFKPNIYSPQYSKVTVDMINTCHSQNVKIIPWTVNDKTKIAELKAMGVDGIITDYPNLLKE
jgi:glycerophosphoryl diester phosphodiesterase